MSKNIKRAISLFIVIIIVIVAIIATFFIVRNIDNRNVINNVREIYTTDVQEILSNKGDDEKAEDINIIDTLTLEIDGDNVVGVLEIDKIGFHDLIYEGTSNEMLNKGVCHMSNSSFLEGNVCIAGHNTSYFKDLKTLEIGDKIIYTSFLGTKTYEVSSMTEINDRDWSLLQDTEENILTLITCIRNKPTKRLCVQATEVF